MRFSDVVIPQLGKALLSIHHDSEAHTKIFSDLTSPTRERRIVLELERGTLIGYYACSQDDNTAQLKIRVGSCEMHAVFQDDALATFMLRTYEHSVGPDQDNDELALNVEVVRVLAAAKRLCAGAGLMDPLPILRPNPSLRSCLEDQENRRSAPHRMGREGHSGRVV